MGAAELDAVRRGFALFAAGRRDAVWRGFSDDFELHDHVVVEGAHLRGPDAMARNLLTIEEAFGDVRWEALEYRDLGDKVLVRVHFQGTGRGSGATVTYDVAQLWTFRDGRAVRFEIFRSLDEALAAAER